MKKFWMVLVAGLLVAAVAAPALAWEFSLTGEFEWRYRYFARQGSGDLFGQTSINPAGVVDQDALGLAGPVSNTVLVQGFSAKGSDAQDAAQRVWLFPEIRINPAVRIRGEYWVTGTNLRGVYDGVGINTKSYDANNWVTNLGYAGWYFNSAFTPGNTTTPVGMSVGLWEKFWMTAQTPWGIIAAGRRPFAFGLGWSTLHEKDADTESIVIAAPYGPFTFIIGPSSPHGAVGDPFVENSYNVVGDANAAGAFPQTVLPVVAAAGTDKNRSRSWHFASAFVYRDGPVEGGIFYTFLLQPNGHFQGAANGLVGVFPAVPAGPAQRDDGNQGALTGAFIGPVLGLSGTTPMYGDIGFVLFVNYFKYNNGRFFFNAEYDFEYGDVRKKGGRPTSVWTDAWELDFGFLCGPGKLTFASFYSSGDDRRGGLFNVTNPTGFNAAAGTFTYDRWTRFLVFGGRQEAMRQYVWLMGLYGGGNNLYDGRGYPQYGDWLSYSARLDYAVAANLNVWGCYTYANRASNTGTRVAQFAGGGFRAASSAAARVPNVPDNYLGWEGNFGVDWKLLEGLVWQSQFGWWQPGDWFKYAYVDQGSLITTTVDGVAYNYNPNRGIDPIIGIQSSLLVSF